MVTYAGSSLTAPLGDAQLNKTTLSTLGYTRGSEVRVLRVEPGCQDRRNHIVQPSTRAETYRARIDVLFVCVCVAIALGFVAIALTRARWTAIYRKPFRNNLTHLANRRHTSSLQNVGVFPSVRVQAQHIRRDVARVFETNRLHEEKLWGAANKSRWGTEALDLAGLRRAAQGQGAAAVGGAKRPTTAP